MVSAYVDPVTARGIEDLVVIGHDLVARATTTEAWQPAVLVDFVIEDAEAPSALTADEYPALARVWDNDEDDNLFAPEPAV